MSHDDEAKKRVLPQSAEAHAGQSAPGPGTAGRTTSGAAYRGHEIAANEDRRPPANPGLP